MPLTLPDDLTRHLTSLLPARNDAQETMAACTLHAWRVCFDQSLPGITAPQDLAAQTTNPQDGEFSPLFIWHHGAFSAWLFSDQSGFIAQAENGLVTALPVIFRIRREAPKGIGFVPRIRSRNRPDAGVSFLTYHDETHLPVTEMTLSAWEQDTSKIKSDTAARYALENLERDIKRLSSLFVNLPRVVQPHNAAPDPEDGSGVISVPFLPQCWYSEEERERAHVWAQDMADWIYLKNHADYESVSVNIDARRPQDMGRPHALTGPFQYHYCRRNAPHHGTMTGFGDVENIISADRIDLPIPHERLCKQIFHTIGRRRHSSAAPKIAVCTSQEEISQHRRLHLEARFGRVGKRAA